MAATQYLVDSNILLRWVKPDHSDYLALGQRIERKSEKVKIPTRKQRVWGTRHHELRCLQYCTTTPFRHRQI